MTIFKKNELIIEHIFDPVKKRHYLNDILTVMHCHHYTSLYTQLAIDANKTELLEDCACESFYEMLVNYFNKHEINSIDARIEIACQYFAAIGLGKMQVNYFGDDTGEVEIIISHVDSGWIKKWGNYDRPINFIGAGFIEAMFASILDEDKKSFKACEIQSIVMGSKTSIFKVFRR